MSVAVAEIAVAAFDPAALVTGGTPAVLRGLASDWALVEAVVGRGADAALDTVLASYGGRPVTGYVGAPEIGGRFFYDAAMAGLNFRAERVDLAGFVASMRAEPPEGRSFYVGSTDIDAFLPGLRAGNDLGDRFGDAVPVVSLWLGNRTVAATHYDMSNNLAVCVAGRRRFTLFPPDQIGNLYPGPLEPTPGGQVVSMVDARAPDLSRYPRFAEAMAVAQVVELAPGDVLFLPALWWHQVEALDPVNLLVNYWWNDVPAHLDLPMTTLLHGLLSLRDRPVQEKRAWAAMFDHYLFGDPQAAGAHLPDHIRGPLQSPLPPVAARRLRAKLIDRLNR